MSEPADVDIKNADDRLKEAIENRGKLSPDEEFWRDRWDWLLQCGYQLRPRYNPKWIPSWKATLRNPIMCEDGQVPLVPQIMDAIRTKDKVQVALKKVKKSEHPQEVEIGTYFSSEHLAQDPRNHCIPFIEVLQVPNDDDVLLIIMPLTVDYDSPDFDTFGEVIDFFRQIFEGLQFMHEHHVAHRDCNVNNIMMDGINLFPEGFHPLDDAMTLDFSRRNEKFTRTKRPPKYYFIDFGISRKFNPADGPPLAIPTRGGDKSVPEFKPPYDLMDPFPTDVYYIGNMIRTEFIDGDPLIGTPAKHGFEFMRPLINDMVQEDPKQRPKMDQVVLRFDDIVRQLGSWKLRSQVTFDDEEDGYIDNILHTIRHWKRRLGFVVCRTPPIPNSSRTKS